MKRAAEHQADDFTELKRQNQEYSLILHQKVGEGIYGKVYQARFANDHKWRAIKILKNGFHDKENFADDMPPIIRELLIGGTCSGLRRSGVVRFASSRLYGVVTNLGHCALSEVAPFNIPLHAVRILGKALLERIHEMHSKGAMHRDLKPDNVLLTWDKSSFWPDVQLIDYGLSSPLEKSMDSNVVTLWWRAPEVLLGLEHNCSLDIWAFGVIIANMCSREKLTRAANVEEALNDVWEKLGYPSQEQWACPRPLWQGKGPPIGLGIHESHTAVLEVLRAALQANPKDRHSAADLLKLSFWSEEADAVGKLQADEWVEKASRKYFHEPQEFPRYFYKAAEITMTYLLDSTLAESDALWLMSALEKITEDHVVAARNIAKCASWPPEALELCVLIMDRTLEAGVFAPLQPKSLAAASGFVTACLYADCEPSLRSLKLWTRCDESEAKIEQAVHTVIAALGYRLLGKDLCSRVKIKERWKIVEEWIKK